MLSSILEKRTINNHKEVTTVSMPPALIEGFETLLLFSIMILIERNYLVRRLLIFLFLDLFV